MCVQLSINPRQLRDIFICERLVMHKLSHKGKSFPLFPCDVGLLYASLESDMHIVVVQLAPQDSMPKGNSQARRRQKACQEV